MRINLLFGKVKYVWKKMNWLVRIMVLILVALYLVAALAPIISPYDYKKMHRRFPDAPPSTIYVGSFQFSFSNPYFFSKGEDWKVDWPYVYRIKLIDPLERTYQELKDNKYYLQFFKDGRLFSVEKPARLFVLGTNRNGWDLFSRVVMAARVSLTIGFIGVLISFGIGILVGCASGYFGGRTDDIIMGICQIMMSIPGFPLLLLLSMVIPPQFSSTMRLFMIITVLSLIGWPGLARTIRGMAASVRAQEHVMAAKAMGASNWRIITRYIIPGVLNFAIISATLSIPGFMLGEAGLSLIGLGIREPDASWGNLLTAAMQNISQLDKMWWILAPGWFIFISIMAFNFLGDFLRDCYDPRMKGSKGIATRFFLWGRFISPKAEEEIDPSKELSREKYSLEVKNLRTCFDTEAGIVKAVDGVGFSLKKGETLGIAGESACGKSVTALSVLRLIQPPGKIVAGEIIFNQKNLLELNQYQIRRVRGRNISMIFQEPMTSLDPIFTIGSQIIEAILEHENLSKAQALNKAKELLKLVQIPTPEQTLNVYPHQLSGGMRQRVMIAIALSCNPQILIADEPTTALDVTVQAQILELLNGLKRKIGMSVIMITHNLGIIAETAQDVAIMYAGRIVEYDSVEGIFGNPKHPYTRGLYKSVPRLGSSALKVKQKLESIPGNVPNPLHLPSGCSFHPRCAYATKPICKEKMPSLKEIGEGHLVRCWNFPSQE